MLEGEACGAEGVSPVVVHERLLEVPESASAIEDSEVLCFPRLHGGVGVVLRGWRGRLVTSRSGTHEKVLKSTVVTRPIVFTRQIARGA